MRRRRTLFVDSDILVVGGGMSGCGAKGPQGEAFPWDTAPRYLLRDRDASYGQTFRDRVEAMAIKEVVTQRDHPGRAGRLGFNETGRRLCCAKLSSTKLAQRRSYSARTGKAYLGYRPSKKSIKRMVENVHDLSTPKSVQK